MYTAHSLDERRLVPGVATFLTLAFLLAFLAPAPVTLAAQAPTLPNTITKQLNAQYPGWSLASVPETAGACTIAPAGSPLLVSADLDNDGTPDYGVVITAGDGTVHALAILPRIKTAAVYELSGEWMGGASLTHLQVVPAGKGYRRIGQIVDDYYSAPTLVASACGATPIAYVWRGTDFVVTPLVR